MIGRQQDYEITPETRLDNLIEEIERKIQELDIQSRSDNFDFNGKEERIFAKEVLEDLLK